jgi:hypothetical protein
MSERMDDTLQHIILDDTEIHEAWMAGGTAAALRVAARQRDGREAIIADAADLIAALMRIARETRPEEAAALRQIHATFFEDWGHD